MSFRVALNEPAATPEQALTVAGIQGGRLRGLGLVQTENGPGHQLWRRQQEAPGAAEGATLGSARGLRMTIERVLVGQTHQMFGGQQMLGGQQPHAGQQALGGRMQKGWAQVIVDFSSACRV